MFSGSIYKLAQWVESLERRIPSMRKMAFVMLVILIGLALFLFSVGAMFAFIISSPAIMGSILASLPVAAIIWCLPYIWRR